MTEPKHIIFDMGQVLIKITFPEFLRKFAEEFKIDQAELTDNRNNGVHIDFMMGKVRPEEFHRQMCSHFNHFISIEKLKQLWLHILGEVIVETQLIVDRLFEKNYPLALLSNVDPWHFEYCKRKLPTLKKFSRIFLSYQLKMKKPDWEIYEFVAKKLQARPQQCLFIDDMLENVEAAKQVGFNCIHFIDAGQLEKNLSAKGIL